MYERDDFYEIKDIEGEGMAPADWEPAAPDAVAEADDPWPRIGVALREILETIVLTVLIFLLIRTVVQNFRIEGYSMEPTLHSRQYLIVEKVSYRLGEPQRGDIVVFDFPGERMGDFIKRVIGLPGERVKVEDGKVFIDDVPLEEPYIAEEPRYTYGPEVLGPNEYFVLGDNRNSSRDSHSWGPLAREHLIGKAIVSYWPPQYWGPIANGNISFASSPP